MNISDPVLAITVIVPLLIKNIILIRLLELNVNFVTVSLLITGLLIKKVIAMALNHPVEQFSLIKYILCSPMIYPRFCLNEDKCQLT